MISVHWNLNQFLWFCANFGSTGLSVNGGGSDVGERSPIVPPWGHGPPALAPAKEPRCTQERREGKPHCAGPGAEGKKHYCQRIVSSISVSICQHPLPPSSPGPSLSPSLSLSTKGRATAADCLRRPFCSLNRSFCFLFLSRQ